MKTVFITGGAKRLGRALVEQYAKDGWRVLFTSRWSFKEGIALSESLGDHVHSVQAEVSSQRNAAMLAEWVGKYTNALDLMICSASSFKKITVADTMPDAFENLMSSNLTGPYFLAQQCHKYLLRAQGSIINIADAHSMSGMPNFSAYGAAKAGLISITKSMALEFAPAVRVNAILPGTLQWPEDEAAIPVSVRSAMIDQIPMQRIGEWSDVVEAVQYLSSAKFVTGVCLPVDGGRSAVY